jgi:XTP/dITP diphosphohydrolase
MDKRGQQIAAFERLLDVMDTLREQCPWDRKQTLQSLRVLTLEEVYELLEALLAERPDDIRQELGDVLLHLVFYSKIADERAWFHIGDVAEALVAKLKRRHPHIYGDAQAEDPEAVKAQWEARKLEEGRESVLGGLPAALPSLAKAMRMQSKASGYGFDWNHTEDVATKVREEVEEFLQEIQRPAEPRRLEAEMGDLLFSLVNLCRFLGIDPVSALDQTNQKFFRRFSYIEGQARRCGLSPAALDRDTMEQWWNDAKAAEDKPSSLSSSHE